MDAPGETTFERLDSWSAHADEAIKFFSGTATYARAIDVPREWLRDSHRVILDLGRVESLAEVLLNGQSLGVAWKPRFLFELAAARPGRNDLEVRVTNAWSNRLIGHVRHPEGFPGHRPPEFTPFLAADVWSRLGKEPAPAGLLGPVLLRVVRRARLH
jgi:hypothetical protein